GGFARVDGHYAFRHFHGRVGLSDIAGDMRVRNTTGRPFLPADVTSRRLRMVDLLAVVGAAPKSGAGPMSPQQKATAARLRALNRILPDTPLNTARLGVMDARVSYRAASVEAGKVPIRRLSMKVDLNHA